MLDFEKVVLRGGRRGGKGRGDLVVSGLRICGLGVKTRENLAFAGLRETARSG
jgi:hypothetical protein